MGKDLVFVKYVPCSNNHTTFHRFSSVVQRFTLKLEKNKEGLEDVARTIVGLKRCKKEQPDAACQIGDQRQLEVTTLFGSSFEYDENSLATKI